MDNYGEVTRRAKEAVISLPAEAAGLEFDSDLRRNLVKFALKSEGAQRLAGMMSLAKSEPGISVLPAEFDASPWLFNVSNLQFMLSFLKRLNSLVHCAIMPSTRKDHFPAWSQEEFPKPIFGLWWPRTSAVCLVCNRMGGTVMKLRHLWLVLVIAGISLNLRTSAGAAQVIGSGLTQPYSMAVDGTNAYWTEDTNYVKWCNKAGSPVNTYWDSGGFPGWTDITSSGHGILAQDGTYLYFAQRAPSATAPSASPTQGPAPLTVHLTAGTPIGNVTGWFWDFSDGNTSGAQNPIHIFNFAGAAYFPTLSVTGPGGTSEPMGAGQILTTADNGNSNNQSNGGMILPSPQIVRFPKFASPQTLPQPMFNYASKHGTGSTGGPLAVNHGKVFFGYWLDNYNYNFNIRGVPTQGATRTGQVISISQNTAQVTCMAADNGFVYWGANNIDGTGAIYSAPQGGSMGSIIQSLSGFPVSLATPTYGAGASKVFWMEQSATFSLLKVCPSVGGQVSVLDNMACPMFMGNVNAIAVDSANVYYFGYSPYISVLQRSIAKNSLTVLASGLVNPQAIAVDNNYVYWTDWGDLMGSAGKGTVNRAPKTSGKVGPPQISSLLPFLLSN